MRVNSPDSLWAELSGSTSTPLAGGENLIGETAFKAAIDTGSLSVIQPDAAKWGGPSGCLAVARAARSAGRRYCPHFLGAGIGLVASSHILAAAGGDGMLEIDVNPNPLRDAIVPRWPLVQDGLVMLPEGVGLGVEPDFEHLSPFETTRLVADRRL